LSFYNKKSFERNSKSKNTGLCQEVIFIASRFLLRHALCMICLQLVKSFEMLTLRDTNNASRVFLGNMLPCRPLHGWRSSKDNSWNIRGKAPL